MTPQHKNTGSSLPVESHPEPSRIRRSQIRVFALLCAAFYFVSALLPFDLVPLNCGSSLFCSIDAAHASDEEKPKAKKSAKKKKVAKKKEKKSDEPEDLSADEIEPVGGKEPATTESFDQELTKVNSIDAVLLLDASGSMQRTDPKRLRDQAAKLFLRFLSEGDRVAIFEFDKDARLLSDLTEISADNISTMDSTIGHVSVEGGFTNLEAPVVSALDLLKEKGRPDAVKTVILLSDGQMDPHPSNGTAEEAIKHLMEEELPHYVTANVHLYTLAMSEEADSELLRDMAKATDALNWYAPDVNTVHLKYSDLFLALKKPQVSPLEGGGFQIDSSVKEATFYIARKSTDQEVSLVSPKGEAFTSVDFPPGTKWFRGEMFDVVTIAKPLPGGWNVKGVEEPDGFATLLTDLKLQVKWPRANMKIGESVSFHARLASLDGSILNEKNLKEITFFQYKIVNTKGGHGLSGTMNDEGKDGDDTAGDGIYGATVKLDNEGDYKALIGVTSPTFVRQQQLPFTVSKGVVTFALEKGDTFAGTSDRFVVSLGAESAKLKGLEVKIAAQLEGAEKIVGYKPTKVIGKEGQYEFSPSKLAAGNYKLTARVSGKDPKTKAEVKAESETIEFVAAGSEAAEGGEEEAPAEAEEGSGDWIGGVIALVIAFAWGGAVIFYVLKKLDVGKDLPSREKKYTRPESLIKELEQLKTKASTTRRPVNPQDLVTFDLVKNVLGPAAAQPAPPAPESTPSEGA